MGAGFVFTQPSGWRGVVPGKVEQNGGEGGRKARVKETESNKRETGRQRVSSIV